MGLIVDVTSDVICPWCFIGKRRLERDIRTLGGRHEVRVRWHPFQLKSLPWQNAWRPVAAT